MFFFPHKTSPPCHAPFSLASGVKPSCPGASPAPVPAPQERGHRSGKAAAGPGKGPRPPCSPGVRKARSITRCSEYGAPTSRFRWGRAPGPLCGEGPGGSSAHRRKSNPEGSALGRAENKLSEHLHPDRLVTPPRLPRPPRPCQHRRPPHGRRAPLGG